MSELKAFDIVVAEEGYCEGFVKYRREVYDKSEADKVIAEKDFLIRMMRKRIYQLKLADAIEKMNFWIAQKFWWESLKDKVTTQPLFDYAAKAETWTKRVEKYKAKLKEVDK